MSPGGRQGRAARRAEPATPVSAAGETENSGPGGRQGRAARRAEPATPVSAAGETENSGPGGHRCRATGSEANMSGPGGHPAGANGPAANSAASGGPAAGADTTTRRTRKPGGPAAANDTGVNGSAAANGSMAANGTAGHDTAAPGAETGSLFEFDSVRFLDIIEIPGLTIAESGVTAFIGPSGTGKSTVLKLMCMLVSPSSGIIRFRGDDLRGIDSVAHRRKVAFLPQAPVMFEGSVRENLIIGHRFQHRGIPADAELIRVLETLALGMPLDTDIRTLSGGEAQRVALGRLLLLRPEVYLLDEPSSSLDEGTEREVIAAAAEVIRGDGAALVVATHSKAVAREFADTVVEFSRGGCAVRRGAL